MNLSNMIGMFGDWDGGNRLAFRREHAENILDDIYVVHRMMEDAVELFSETHPDLQLEIIRRAFYRAFGHSPKHAMFGIEAKNDEDALVFYETWPNNIETLHVTAEIYRKANRTLSDEMKNSISDFIVMFLREKK